MIAFISMLEVFYFCVNMKFCLESFESEYSYQIKKIYIEIMPKYHSASKILFYHLPTRGRAGIKLGDA